MHGIREHAWKRLGEALGAVVLISTVLGFIGFAFAESYSALFHLEHIDSGKIGQQVVWYTGSIGVVAALLYTALHG